MLSFEQGYTNIQNNVQDYDSDALVYLKRNYNIGLHILESEIDSFWIEAIATRTSEDDTGSYSLPADYIRMKEIHMVVGSQQYNLEQVFTEEMWQALQASYYGSYSDEPTHFIARSNTFEVFPGLDTAGNTITLRYESGGKDLQYADYTDGTISDLANGAKAVTGSSTTFTAAMVNRWLKINNDASWYRIASFSSTTSITLDRPYEGTTISGGSESYTIGEFPNTPGPTHHIPGIYAEWQYYQGYKQNDKKGSKLERQFWRAIGKAKETYGKRYSSNYIPGRNSQSVSNINPNYPPRQGSIT